MEKLPIDFEKEFVEDFCRKHHISYFALFGSILTPHFNPKSDIDVLVKFPPKYIPHLFGIAGMESELSESLGRTVDLKTPQDLSPYFRDEVLACARVLYPVSVYCSFGYDGGKI